MSNHESVLVEVSLALAMAFFALMVLALVSIGIPAAGAPDEAREARSPATIGLQSSPGDGASTASADHFIYHDGRWFDLELREVTTAALTAGDGEVVVAVSPDASLRELTELNVRFARRGLAIAALTPEWLQRLEAMP